MKLRERIVWILIAAVLLLLIVGLAVLSCRDLLGEFGEPVSAPTPSLPLPAVLLLAIAPLAAILLAALLVLRSLARIRRREAESEQEEDL